jgi:uncharacterized membrane protein
VPDPEGPAPLAPPPAAAAPPADAAPRHGLFGRRAHRLDTRISGEDLGRIISLSDGVFAFALTLLVLSLAVPVAKTGGPVTNGQLGALLNHDYGTFAAYAFAFFMIAIWWVVHNRTYLYIARFDNTLVWLNMFLLAQIAVMPFILGVYSTYGFGSADQPALQYAVVLFAAVQISLGLTTTGMWEYARFAKLTKPNVAPEISRFFTRRGLFTSAVFAISIGISFYSTVLAELSWVGIFFVQRLLTYAGD